MKSKLIVVKLGGNCMDDSEQLQLFLESFCKLPAPKILVHGGGKLASNLARQLNIPSKMIDGRRVTCESTLQVVTMTYAGAINKELVAELQALKCNAIGLCGADGNLILAGKRNPVPVDFGYVGDPVGVNVQMLRLLIGAGFTPIICPITHDGKGQLLNTNADTVAAFIAASLTDDFDIHLLYAFDKSGVLSDSTDENSVVPLLSFHEYEELKTTNQISGGMLPKLNAGFLALKKNVSQVTLQHLSTLEEEAVSTHLVL